MLIAKFDPSQQEAKSLIGKLFCESVQKTRDCPLLEILVFDVKELIRNNCSFWTCEVR